jgi:hypothetical protein
MSINQIKYGIGGYDPDHPNQNIIEVIVDNNDGTAVRTLYNDDGSVKSVINMTDVPVDPPFEALDSIGSLATLLVVVGTLDLEDAANAIHEEPAHLEHEALAWSLG